MFWGVLVSRRECLRLHFSLNTGAAGRTDAGPPARLSLSRLRDESFWEERFQNLSAVQKAVAAAADVGGFKPPERDDLDEDDRPSAGAKCVLGVSASVAWGVCKSALHLATAEPTEPCISAVSPAVSSTVQCPRYPNPSLTRAPAPAHTASAPALDKGKVHPAPAGPRARRADLSEVEEGVASLTAASRGRPR